MITAISAVQAAAHLKAIAKYARKVKDDEDLAGALLDELSYLMDLTQVPDDEPYVSQIPPVAIRMEAIALYADQVRGTEAAQALAAKLEEIYNIALD